MLCSNLMVWSSGLITPEINIYSRLKGQASWGFLSRDKNSPYDDH
jgi:hypothetical protein